MVHTWGQRMFRLLALVILIHTSLCLKAVSPGQNDQGKQKVSVIADNKELQEVFRSLKQQTGLTFFYSERLIDDKERITVNMVNKTLDEVLQKVLGSRGLIWEYTDNVVGIKKSEERHRSSRAVDVIEDTTVTSKAITGKVVSPDGSPIPGATVMLKGTKHGTTTNSDGTFLLPRDGNSDILVISSVGFEKREIEIKGNSILARLNLSVNTLEETVIVAYGTSSQRDNVGSVTSVKGETISRLPNQSFDRSLQGQVPGLLVTSGNGQPGGGTSNFIIRGIGTGAVATSGSPARQPLIVIDGLPLINNDPIQPQLSSNPAPVTNILAQLNPNDIESISVLKDAAAIALYGSKASNGVILITTKKGISGRTTFTFHHQTDISAPINRSERLLNREQYLDLLFESYKNADPARWTDDEIRKDLMSKYPTYINSEGHLEFYEQSNWFDALYNNISTTVTNEISASGGSEKTNYYFNVGYSTQNGTIKHTNFDRFSLRFNFSNKPVSWFKYGINSTLAYTDQNYASALGSGTEDAGFTYTVSPLSPVYLKDGTYNLQPFLLSGIYINNPIAALEYNINRTNAYRFLGDLYGEIKFLKHFTLRADIGSDVMFAQVKQKFDSRLSVGLGSPPGTGQITDNNIFSSRILSSNILRYERLFGTNHNLTFLLGQEAQIEQRKDLAGTREGLSIPYLDDLSSATLTTGAYGSSVRTTLLSYFSQVNYNFKNRYLLSLSGRRDGSSKFGSRNQYGNYWAIGGGWIFSDEPLFQSISKWFDYAKIRGSVGTSGNSAVVSPTTRYNLVTAGSYNGSPTAAVTPGNPEIGWEESFNIDLGLELRLFDNRISTTVDLYKRNISNLLYAYNMPGTSGVINMIQNVGKMQNKGIEVSISGDVIRNKNLRWHVDANWSANRNELIKADVPLTTDGNLVNKEDENFNSFYLVRWAGVNPDDGKPLWLDKEGKETGSYSSDNKIVVGKPQPDGYGAITNIFRYKDFELSFLFYYQYGYEIYDATSALLLNDGATYPYANQSTGALDRWQKPGDISINPRRVLSNRDRGNRASTRYLFSGDFIRLKNVRVSYDFPNSLIDHIRLKAVRLYAQGNNIALITKFKGFDPENLGTRGETGFTYPQSKSFSIGLDVTF